MKPLRISEDVLSVGELASDAPRVLRRLKASQRPVVITDEGRPAAVLITPEEFDRMSERERFLAAVAEGLEDSEAERVIEDDDLERELDERFGPSTSA